MAINDSTLSKGQLRKLNALRKSVGNSLGEEVFRKWLAQQERRSAPARAAPQKAIDEGVPAIKRLEVETITSLRITNLFGRFNHEVDFSKESEISIITAPNGYGKTVLLRIIDSLFNRRLGYFRKITFDTINIYLGSGKTVSVIQQKKEVEDKGRLRQVEFQGHGFGAGAKRYELPAPQSASNIGLFERYLPVERVGADHWYDFRSQTTVSTDYIVRAYGDQLPKRFGSVGKMPEWLEEVTSSVDAHLIETQRLLYLDQANSRGPRSNRESISSSVVEKDAADLSVRIRELLQNYADESQKLDQTFPERIVKHDVKQVSDEGSIRASLQELTNKRDDLVSVGLLGSTISEPIRPSQILDQENIRRILEIYIEDTQKKLSIFDETYEKIRLFKELLDEQFAFKEVEIDSTHGIRVVDDENDTKIPLSGLSSGEQHELVLVYELLFKVPEGAVILLDEPELSLHVSWQKKFIDDLQRIQAQKKLRVIIATHSPQIIHNKWRLVQELGA